MSSSVFLARPLGSLLLAVALATPAFAAAAQQRDPVAPVDAPAPRERVPLLQKKDLATLGWMLLATAATMPFDRTIAHEFADSSLQANRTYRRAVDHLTTIHERSLFVYSAIGYAGGLLFRSAPVADAGLHSAEAIAVGTVIGSFLKSTVGRARPRAADGDPFDFRFAKGYTSGEYRSFPSLHEIGSFAAASAITSEVARHNPGAGRVVGVVAYGGAGLVGLARMYSAQHWASDVVLGSAMGVMIGRRIVAHAHSGEPNSLDRFLLGGLAADANGMRVELYSKDF
ncbi:MAG TPA: phosphatase PAP2 family protein [Gemmatimonadaceae bacterium]